jgi:hypothetical protein
VAEQHLANFELWHAEDMARTPEASDQDLARIKRFIDRANQRRNDLSEQCDVFLLNFLSQQNLPAPGAELHSESPGLILDRLSILSLKLFHTREEIDRPQAPPGHASAICSACASWSEQRDDLAGSARPAVAAGSGPPARFKLYRQLKMYNDPALNPAVYSPRSNAGPLLSTVIFGARATVLPRTADRPAGLTYAPAVRIKTNLIAGCGSGSMFRCFAMSTPVA